MKDNITINVRFHEFTSKTQFANSDIPVEQLPETFEINTMLHFGDSDWKVMEANPIKKSEFAKLGKVDLFLAKVETMNPANILYTLPSINDDLPSVVDTKAEDILVLLEDDWRQTECVENRFIEEINQEISDIKKIYSTERESAGFRNMHIRKIISAPLNTQKILLESTKQHFQVQKSYQGVGFNSSHGIIANGFAFSTISNWILWGQITEEKNISFLNVIAMENALIEPFSTQMNVFLKKEQLYLVDWTRMFIAGNDHNSFEDFINF